MGNSYNANYWCESSAAPLPLESGLHLFCCVFSFPSPFLQIPRAAPQRLFIKVRRDVRCLPPDVSVILNDRVANELKGGRKLKELGRPMQPSLQDVKALYGEAARIRCVRRNSLKQSISSSSFPRFGLSIPFLTDYLIGRGHSATALLSGRKWRSWVPPSGLPSTGGGLSSTCSSSAARVYYPRPGARRCCQRKVRE